MNTKLSVEEIIKRYPPFENLTEEQVKTLVNNSNIKSFSPNEQILSGELSTTNFLWIILKGEVRIGTPRLGEEFDDYIEKLKCGNSFGFVAAIDPTVPPPRAVSLTNSELLAIPAELVRPLFFSSAGAKYLAKQLQSSIEKPSIRQVTSVKSGARRARDLIKRPVLKCSPNLSVREAANLMTKGGYDYIITESEELGIGILTDFDIRSKLVAEGASLDAPVKNYMTFPAKTFSSESTAFDLMVFMLDNNLQYLPLEDEKGNIIGLVKHKDFLSAPSSSSFSLSKKIAYASLEELKIYFTQLQDLNLSMFEKHYTISQISELRAIVIEEIIARCIDLEIAKNDEISSKDLTWFTLGSIARREVMLTSDIESALAIVDLPSETVVERTTLARQLAKSVHKDLEFIGLKSDTHGVLGANYGYSKTAEGWKKIAKDWIKNPLNNQAMVKASLMFDARPVWGVKQESPVASIYREVQKYPRAYKLMLQEALTAKAKLHSVRDIISMKTGYFNIKNHALLPIVNLARWAALSVKSRELGTINRLRAASGHGLINEPTAAMLIEVFNIVQKIRFENHLRQIKSGEKASDIVSLKKISTLDKSLLSQAVREVAFIQKKIMNLSQYTALEEWA